jgi:plastocyanin domain-containing protein
MDTTEIIVVAGGVLLVGFVAWFFFMGEGRREAAAVGESGTQRVKILVKGGYTPDVVVLKRGVPAELDFYRDEVSSCTEQVVLPEFRISRMLAAFETTTVSFTPEKEGEFAFTCGMSMVRGRLVVEG